MLTTGKRKSTSWDDDPLEKDTLTTVKKIQIPKPTNNFFKSYASLAPLKSFQRSELSSMTFSRKDLKVESSDIPNKSLGETKPASFQSSKSSTISSKEKVVQDAPIVTLSIEQKDILDRVKRGTSLFFTGKAGTGKSFLLKHLIEKPPVLKSEMSVTASTGLAAYQISGVTLHSFAGQAGVDDLIKMVKRNKQTFNRWKTVRLLIIDEGTFNLQVSMIDGDFFDKLEEIARRIRGNEKPFGGIQVVLCGDFLQLPPVNSNSTKFVFESKSWASMKLEIMQLKTVFRQSDRKFLKILNEMRIGQLASDSIEELKRLSRPLETVYKATHLYSLRNEVDSHNKRELGALSGEYKTFKAKDTVKDPKDKKKLNDSLLCPEVLELRVGAQVMIVKNLRSTALFNGCIGKVTGFYVNEKDSGQDGVYVEFEFGPESKVMLINREMFELEKAGQGVYASRYQLPLVLSYAMSIHKSQGQTLNFVHVDLKSVFEKGQAYVALSRCTSLQGLVVKNFDASRVKAHAKVLLIH